MRDLKKTLLETSQLLVELQQLISRFLESYKAGMLQLPIPSANEVYKFPDISYEGLEKYVVLDLNLVSENLKRLKTFQENLESGIFEIDLDYSQFKIFPKNTVKLISQNWYASTIGPEHVHVYCCDRVSKFFYQHFKICNSKFHTLLRQLVKSSRFSVIGLLKVSLSDDNQFDLFINSLFGNVHIQHFEASVDKISLEVLLEEEFIETIVSTIQLFSFEIKNGYLPLHITINDYVNAFSMQLKKLPSNRSIFVKLAFPSYRKNFNAMYFLKTENGDVQHMISTLGPNHSFNIKKFDKNSLSNLIGISDYSAEDLHKLNDGYYPVDYAVKSNDILCIRYLMARKGRYSSPKDSSNVFTVLHLACEFSTAAVISYLSSYEDIRKMISETGYSTRFGFLKPTSLLEIAIYRTDSGLDIARALVDVFGSVIHPDLISLAFNKKQFAIVELFLMEGVHIDKKMSNIFKKMEVPSNFRLFLNRRRHPFLLIERGWINDFKNWHAEDAPININTYLNFDNQSLLFFAYQSKAYEIYGFLISIGATFTNKDEESIAGKLGLEFENAVAKYISVSTPKEKIIPYLMSCTHVRCLPKTSIDIFGIYRELVNNHHNIFQILEVIMYANPRPQIIIDTLEKNITNLYSDSLFGLGLLYRTSHRIYIEVGDNELDRLGILIRELTHLACKLVYNNESFPYYRDSNEEATMKSIKNEMYDKRRNPSFKKDVDQLKFFRGMFDSYTEENNQLKELIVRVPQTLVVYGSTGLEVLRNYATRLLDYYINIFVPDCCDYVNKMQEKDLSLSKKLLL